MSNITFEQLTGLLAVALLLIGAYNTVMAAVKNHREEKRLRESPVNALKERVDRHDELLAKDKERMDEFEHRIQDMSAQSVIMLRGFKALLSHEVNGNSTDKLKDSMTEIDDYLIRRK